MEVASSSGTSVEALGGMPCYGRRHDHYIDGRSGRYSDSGTSFVTFSMLMRSYDSIHVVCELERALQ